MKNHIAKGLVSFGIAVFLSVLTVNAADCFVSFSPVKGGMTLVANGTSSTLVVDEQEYEGVRMAAQSLADDIKRVSGATPTLTSTIPDKGTYVLVGTIEQPSIKAALKDAGIALSELKGKNEKYILTTTKSGLLIAGSDKRGAIYGIYELSRQIGVSPWYWMMDVPVEKHEAIYIKKGLYTDGEPKVAYRGIFINDEWPSFGNWAISQFGGINSKCYQHIFELLLRLKANFMWPAMWGSAFYSDDPENGVLADKMGIVMSTSHHEPMNLAQRDWKKQGGTEKLWNYVTNEQGLKDFWRGGIERSKNYETVITVGMRGDGDMEMPNSDDNKALLERIVRDQRAIIEDVMDKPASEVPQVWALYKEVQDYYDDGLKVPDDITLLLCDDNWGNIRRVPTDSERNRKGGFGMYYHFDYVGGPRNSKWINISPIPRVWEQMNLCYQYGIDKIWIVNVGDLKPMEYPIQFFMDMAWNPEQFNQDNLVQHAEAFCRSVFGDKYAAEAARLLRTYAKFNRRVTPETLNDNTYSFQYNEWARVCADHNRLRDDARKLEAQLPEQYQSAYFQLLGLPIEGMANLYNMYYAVAMNKRLAKKKDAAANDWADVVVECFRQDSLLSVRYHQLNGGKWNHLMDEIRIGYTRWNAPEHRIMPKVQRISGEKKSEVVLPVADKPYALYSSVKAPCTFKEVDGYVTIEAEHYTRKQDGKEAKWTVIPELGRTLSGFTTEPVTAKVDGAFLEYDFTCESTGYAKVIVRLAPTLNYIPAGQRYRISIDGKDVHEVNINGHYKGELGEWQRNHCIDMQTIFTLDKAGKHTLRIEPLDNGIVLEKIAIDLGGLHRSFLFPDETLK